MLRRHMLSFPFHCNGENPATHCNTEYQEDSFVKQTAKGFRLRIEVFLGSLEVVHLLDLCLQGVRTKDPLSLEALALVPLLRRVKGLSRDLPDC